MAAEATRRRRCAVYTRKSSEEGLEQDFNSLDAQREACEAYIRSQAGEGWKLVPTRYDDGGYSGGNVERPGLQKLLADIEAKKVDTVVVYKVDRLTRSLGDFAKIVDVLDAHGVSFVSVTQQFNTTTSMGRLTLNMLLSFAQFEREVTGERIRDKIAASKRKGMWMGGFVPLGYEAAGRTLQIVESEAQVVRKIFQLYLELGAVSRAKIAVDRLGLRSKARHTRSKKTSGGHPLGRGHLYRILNNPIYAGRIRHKGQEFEGQHPAIIDNATWTATQEKLISQTPRRATQTNLAHANPLRGKLFDESGQALTPTHCTKGGRRYRYYVSSPLADDDSRHEGAGGRRRWRLAAREIELFVASQVSRVFAEPDELTRLLQNTELSERQIADLVLAIGRWKGTHRDLVTRIDLGSERITIQIDVSQIVGEPGTILHQEVSAITRRRGVETRLVLTEEKSALNDPRVDASLIKAIVRARGWFDDLASGRFRSLEEIGKANNVSDRYVSALLSLAFLSPEIVSQALDGTQDVRLTTQALVKNLDLPLAWKTQCSLTGQY